MKKIVLNKNWKFKVSDISGELEKFNKWMSCSVPGTVHTDLLELGLIEDPFFEDNELKLQWISNCDWIYKTSFDLPDEFESDSPVIIVFEGLDTIAEVWLNKEHIGNFNNMFRRYELDITSKIKDKNNELEIKFTSPIKYAKALEEKHGELYVEVNTERVYIRKAQYSFGWDWGPSFPTMGIYKPIYLLQKNKASIKNLKFNTVEISKSKAIVEVDIEIENSIDPNCKLEVSLSLMDRMIDEKAVTKVSTTNKIRMEIDNPALWWPCCQGDQPLYNLKAILKDNNEKIIDLSKRTVGIRTVELLLKKDGENTFKFLINKKEIFIKGVNWIPTDSFLPRVSEEKYIKLLSLAKEANCNMIRVWGGGIYEQDIFYTLCDEIGLLVWQDFMFACGSYPEHDEFIENVNIEIKQNVERLQHHPSIAMWCGNNECEWQWYSNREDDISKLPGYNIYHQIIPSLLKNIDPLRPYWPSSPFGYDEDPNDQNSGNTHQWNIWSNWIDYSEVTKDNSLFVSEFGFQGSANINTLEKCLSPEHRKIQDGKFEFHNKQVEGQDRIFKFLSAHLPISTQWEDFIYLSQLNQGLALKRCIEHWRANRPRTNGSIIWQLNDCWPVVSWSLVDSSYLPKLAYYFVKRAFAPVGILFRRENSNLKIYGLNQGSGSFKGYIKLAIISLVRGDVLYEINKESLLRENSYKPIINIPKAYQKNLGEYIYIVTLNNEKDELITRNHYIAREWKHIQSPKSKINIRRSSSKKKDEIIITSNYPAYFVDLYHPKISFSDRGFILLPGETKKIKIVINNFDQVDPKKIEVYSLNKYLSP